MTTTFTVAGPAASEASSSAYPQAARQTVLMLVGGGLSHASGGVGTQISYLLSNWSATELAPEIRVLDTRGAGGLLSGAIRFAGSGAVVLYSCASRRPLIVHAHMTTRGSALRKSVLCALAHVLGAKIVVHQHGADFEAFFHSLPRPARSLLRAVLKRAHAVVVLGDSARLFFMAEVGISAERLFRIPNGVPRVPLLSALARDAAPPLLLFLGRLGDRKGVPELLAALATDELRCKSWRAVLAGDGEVGRFRDRVDQLGLNGRVEIRGWQSRQEASELLGSACILVLPSRHEALPVVILEALSFGVAVIATPVGSIPDFLRDGVDALLTPPGDPERLALAIIALLDDPGRRAKLAANGHRTFLAELQIEAVAKRLSDLYGTLVARGGHERPAMLTGLAEDQLGGLSRTRRSSLEDVWSLVARLNIVSDGADKAALLQQLSGTQRPMVVAFVNQHALNLVWARSDFAAALHSADILLRDGVGIEFFLKLNGCSSGHNMNGTDFIPELAAAYAGRRVALLGTKSPWTGLAAAALASFGCDVVVQLDGFQQDEIYLRSLEAARPELVILAMGMPRQELLAARLSETLSYPTVIVNGGAIADFLAGQHNRAPRVLREARLEWLFRLTQEPRRLARRYLAGGPAFLWRVAVLRHRSTPILLRLLQKGPAA